MLRSLELVTKCCRCTLVPIPVMPSRWSLVLLESTVLPVGMSSSSTLPDAVPMMARPSSSSSFVTWAPVCRQQQR